MRDRPDSQLEMRPLPPSGSGEFLDAIDCLRRGLDHIGERWEQGLALNNASLADKYLSGRFSIALYFDAARAEHERASYATSVHGDRETSCPIVVLINNRDVGDCLWDGDQNEQPVFVTNVELVDGPQKYVSSFVRSYRVNEEPPEAGDGFLYGSVTAFAYGFSVDDFWLGSKGTYKFLSLLIHGEGNSGILPAQQLPYGVVQSALEVVDGIPQYQRELGRDGINRLNLNVLSRSLRVVLHRDFAEVRLEEREPLGMKLLDVLVGPYKL